MKRGEVAGGDSSVRWSQWVTAGAWARPASSGLTGRRAWIAGAVILAGAAGGPGAILLFAGVGWISALALMVVFGAIAWVGTIADWWGLAWVLAWRSREAEERRARRR